MMTEQELRNLGISQDRAQRMLKLQSMLIEGELPAQQYEVAALLKVSSSTVSLDLRILNGERSSPQRDRNVVSSQNARARAFGLSTTVTLEEWRSVCEEYRYECALCGCAGVLAMDHIVPLSLGGTHERSNIQPLCMSCNCRKQARLYDVRDMLTPAARIALRDLAGTSGESEGGVLSRLVLEEKSRQSRLEIP